MDMRERLASLGREIIAVGVGFVVYVLFSILLNSLRANYPEYLLNTSPIFYPGILITLVSGTISGYLNGRNGILIGLILLVLTSFLNPLLLVLYFLTLTGKMFNTYVIMSLYPFITFPLGGWLGEKLYFRLHRESEI